MTSDRLIAAIRVIVLFAVALAVVGCAPAPRPTPGAPPSRGTLPPHVIQRVVRSNFGPFRQCYAEALAHNPSLHGDVRIRFVIQPNGAVTDTSAADSGIPDPAITACVAKNFRRLHFPPPEGGGVITVVYPIMFSPLGVPADSDGCRSVEQAPKDDVYLRFRTCPPRVLQIIEKPGDPDETFAAQHFASFEQGGAALHIVRNTDAVAGRPARASVLSQPGKAGWSTLVVTAQRPGRALVVYCADVRATGSSDWCKQEIEKAVSSLAH